MQQESFNLLQSIYLLIANNTVWQGTLLAITIAALRVLYDNQAITATRVTVEALLCGALAICVSSVVELLEWPEPAVIILGGAIGFIGITTLRDYLLKVLKKKFAEQTQQEDEEKKK